MPASPAARATGEALLSGGSAERLLANLEALEAKQRDLAARVRLPVDSDHVVAGEDGRPALRVGRSTYALELSPAEVDARVEALDVGPKQRVIVFGVGLGELVDGLLAALPRHARIVAWERDPWLLRLALARRDWRSALRSGRLRLALLSDLVPLARERGSAAIVDHPLLVRAYAHERRFLDEDRGRRRALVARGGLYVDSLTAALRRRGWSVLTFGTGVAVEELELLARRSSPGLVAAINYTDGLAEFCRAHDAPLVVWEIDPATEAPRPPSCPTDHVRLFTYRHAMLQPWRDAGFAHVEYLPLAADDELRRPEEDAGRRAEFAAPVAFVGSSLARNAAGFRARFAELHRAWSGRSDPHVAEELADELLAAQRADFSSWILPDRLAGAAPGFAEWCRADGRAEDPALLLGELAAGERRLAWIGRLGPCGAHVWGDAGWRELESVDVRYRGPAAHRGDLNAIYSGATVNVDVGRLYQTDMVTLRVFDVLACGGFALVEHSAALEDLFAVGEELESFRDADELERKVRHYLAHPDEARAVAKRGRAAVLERHRFDDRIAHALASLPTPVAG